MRILAILTLFFALNSPAAANESCRDETYKNNSYTLCSVDLAHETISLFLYKPDGTPYGQFSTLERSLLARGKQLAFAMNAGMYHEDRSPVGHYVENGVALKSVMSRASPGNFGLLPNGVLCIRPDRTDVIETKAFLKQKPTCIHATQSGPMLVIDGNLHPRFLPDSTSKHVRNGVGTTADGKTAIFVISNASVTFHQFGSFFRDFLHLPQALYFDGSISRLYAPNLNRSDFGFLSLGPIVGVVTDK
jgi:uncharacterized protein YigE (DUF2233 family)